MHERLSDMQIILNLDPGKGAVAGVVKDTVTRIALERPDLKSTEVLVAAPLAHNEMKRVRGFSQSQWTLGRSPIRDQSIFRQLPVTTQPLGTRPGSHRHSDQLRGGRTNSLRHLLRKVKHPSLEVRGHEGARKKKRSPTGAPYLKLCEQTIAMEAKQRLAENKEEGSGRIVGRTLMTLEIILI